MSLFDADTDMIVIPKNDFNELLDSAAERGAGQVLQQLGLENTHAAKDIRELRGLLETWRDARRTALRTTVKIVTTGLLSTLLLGAAIKFKLLGG